MRNVLSAIMTPNQCNYSIQDAMKFPDFVHAVKPEPHNEVPTGQSAHNNFWDYFCLQPESEPTAIYFNSEIHYKYFI